MTLRQPNFTVLQLSSKGNLRAPTLALVGEALFHFHLIS
jgi:hypothetical protein